MDADRSLHLGVYVVMAPRSGKIATGRPWSRSGRPQAIAFGNPKDEGSDELGTRPFVTYFKKVVRTHA